MIGLDDPGVTKLSLENLVVTVDNEFLRRMTIRNCSSQFCHTIRAFGVSALS